jgi:hypothetical protein
MFYEFSKIWSKSTTLEESICTEVPRQIWVFTTMPTVFTTRARKQSNLCTGSPMVQGSSLLERGRPVLANKRTRVACALTSVRLGAELGSETAPASAGGGAEAMRPLGFEFRQEERQCGTTSARARGGPR